MFVTDFKTLQIDERIKPRFEPLKLNAIIKNNDSTSIKGKVLDVSRSGIAVAIPVDAKQPPNGKINLELSDPKKDQKIELDGEGTIVRRWNRSRYGGVQKGFAIKFENSIKDQDQKYDEFCFNGVRQRARIAHQANIAVVDMDYLGQYRQKLIDCQLRLFILSLTIGVSLAGAYFGLSYHSALIHGESNSDLSFWRAMIAALPALLALASAFICVQKSITIQRIDAFLSIIKERMINFQYPREYKGWENSIRKFRYVLKSDKCEDCWSKQNCGRLTDKEKKVLSDKGIFRYPDVDIYHVSIYLTFAGVFAVSLGTVVYELMLHKWGLWSYMLITFIISVFVVLVGLYFIRAFWNLRKSKFSFEYFKRCWLDILNNCRQPV